MVVLSRTETSGDGVVRTVYQSALQQSTKSHRWKPSTAKGYHILHLSRNPDLAVDETMEYRVEGQIAALFTAHFAVGPDPISPFVILAATIDKIDEFEFDIDFARAMIHDTELLKKVEQIFNLPPEEKVEATDMPRAWLHLLATDLELPVSITIDHLDEDTLIFSGKPFDGTTPGCSEAPEDAEANACGETRRSP